MEDSQMHPDLLSLNHSAEPSSCFYELPLPDTSAVCGAETATGGKWEQDRQMQMGYCLFPLCVSSALPASTSCFQFQVVSSTSATAFDCSGTVRF